MIVRDLWEMAGLDVEMDSGFCRSLNRGWEVFPEILVRSNEKLKGKAKRERGKKRKAS
jgi:hypothetical protein